MPLKSTAGWLPIEIGLDRRPDIVPEAMVRWMEFGATPLAEPFFDHTMEKLRAATPAAREIDTDVDTLLRVGARLKAVQPVGFIFHISHCGSTLISNAMKTSDEAVVVSESRPVSVILRSRAENVSPYLRERWEVTRRALLDSMFSLFAHHPTGQPHPLVIKFPSVSIMSMELVRSYWPDVPCVIVIRDPVEVMVSSLSGGGWMTFKERPELATEIFGWSSIDRPVSAMLDQEFCARVLGSFCEAALRAHDDKCMVVDYLDLSPNKMREIAAFFKLPLRDHGNAVDAVFSPYSKDPAKAGRFRDDRKRKQEMATVFVRSAANQWAMAPYAELRKRTRP
jgi:hypothetical protein